MKDITGRAFIDATAAAMTQQPATVPTPQVDALLREHLDALNGLWQEPLHPAHFQLMQKLTALAVLQERTAIAQAEEIERLKEELRVLTNK